MREKEILVYADWLGLGGARLMGRLYAAPVRGKEVFSFEYTSDWLASPQQAIIDPDLNLYAGPQYLRDEKSNFGVFLDSSPDRWGRVLMRRREAALARIENRKAVSLFESDYLLGVFDEHRMGALRFKEDRNGPFLNDNRELAAPPWTSLRTLEHASLQLEKENAAEEPEYLKWLNLLIAPGSSLGGARPKAGVVDENNHLWIAKFPSKNDSKNKGAWEMIANQLAKHAGINTAQGKAQKFSNRYHTYLTKRFDRAGKRERIHFASAMTMLGYKDGVDNTAGVSYLELAEFLMRYGAQTDQDLEELWRRIVFNICITNTDDHLRNHGFILKPKGWILSPAYDVNPEETGTGLHLNITEDENALNLDLALETAAYYRLDHKKAKAIVKKVQTVVAKWKGFAEQLNISKTEIEQLSGAFRNFS